MNAKFLAFGILINGGGNGDQLPCFVEKVIHFCFGNGAAVRKKFEPRLGLFDFLRAITDFGNEFGF